MRQYLLLCLSLLMAVSLLVMLGQRLRIPYPIFLVLSGLGISFIPGIPLIEISPDLIFLIFLPPLLYQAAWYVSWKDFWKWRRVIGALGFGVVILTAWVVATISVTIIPGFTWALGFLLGGIISPSDAISATSVLKETKIPRRLVAILEGESLVNDAASLVVFRFALTAVLSGVFVFQQAISDFMLVTFGGLTIGLVVAFVFYTIHRWIPTTPNIHTVLTLVSPYIMYLMAEEFSVSGVIAVVSGGLFLSYHSHQIYTSATRLQSLSTWATLEFILNGLVFILIGLQMPLIVSSLGTFSKTEAISYSLIITISIVCTRLLCSFAISLLFRILSKFIKTNDSNPGWRGPLIIGWSGMRGVVSLASALSIPLLTTNGSSFSHRNLILFITFLTILLTLVVQGLTLPIVIRWAMVDERDGIRPIQEQEAIIHQRLSQAALQQLKREYTHELWSNELVRTLKKRFENDQRLSTQRLESKGMSELEHNTLSEFIRIYNDLIQIQRKTLRKLHNEIGINDDLIRKHEAQLDLDAERLSLFTTSTQLGM